MPESRNWKRLALEAVVIVSSILLAFGIDAWWQEGEEQREVRESLAALRSEFVENRSRLDSAIVSGERRVAAIDGMLRKTTPVYRLVPEFVAWLRDPGV